MCHGEGVVLRPQQLVKLDVGQAITVGKPVLAFVVTDEHPGAGGEVERSGAGRDRAQVEAWRQLVEARPGHGGPAAAPIDGPEPPAGVDREEMALMLDADGDRAAVPNRQTGSGRPRGERVDIGADEDLARRAERIHLLGAGWGEVHPDDSIVLWQRHTGHGGPGWRAGG